jgi:hypothetical protein
MVERMRSSVNVESPEAFNAGNPLPIDGSLVGLLSNLPVPPLEYASNAHTSICVHAI